VAGAAGSGKGSDTDTAEPDGSAQGADTGVLEGDVPVRLDAETGHLIELTGSDLCAERLSTQVKVKDFDPIQPMLQVTLVHADSGVIVLADGPEHLIFGWYEAIDGSGRCLWCECVGVLLIVQDLHFRAGVPDFGELLGDVEKDAAIAFGIHAPFQFEFKIPVLLARNDVNHLALFDGPECSLVDPPALFRKRLLTEPTPMLRGSAVEEDHPRVSLFLRVSDPGEPEAERQDPSCCSALRSRPVERSCGSHKVPESNAGRGPAPAKTSGGLPWQERQGRLDLGLAKGR
jgi:hypothetical protein